MEMNGRSPKMRCKDVLVKDMSERKIDVSLASDRTTLESGDTVLPTPTPQPGHGDDEEELSSELMFM